MQHSKSKSGKAKSTNTNFMDDFYWHEFGFGEQHALGKAWRSVILKEEKCTISDMKLIAAIPPRDSNTNPTRSVVPSLLPTILCTKSVTSHRITAIVDVGGRKAKVLMGCRWPNRSLPQAIPADCRVCRSPCSQQSSRRTGLLCSSVSLQMGSKYPPSHLPQSHCPSPGELEFHP